MSLATRGRRRRRCSPTLRRDPDAAAETHGRRVGLSGPYVLLRRAVNRTDRGRRRTRTPSGSPSGDRADPACCHRNRPRVRQRRPRRHGSARRQRLPQLAGLQRALGRAEHAASRSGSCRCSRERPAVGDGRPLRRRGVEIVDRTGAPDMLPRGRDSCRGPRAHDCADDDAVLRRRRCQRPRDQQVVPGRRAHSTTSASPCGAAG